MDRSPSNRDAVERRAAMLRRGMLVLAAVALWPGRAGAALPADLQLQLPFPCGRTAYIFCGYDTAGGTFGYCPLHTGRDRYALDFTHAFTAYSPDHALGEPVTAVASGNVALAGTLGGYGLIVIVAHDTSAGTYHSLYAHLDALSVKAGDQVVTGQEVGKLGRSGSANGIVHLHFVLRKGAESTGGEAAVPEPMSGHTGFAPEQRYPVACAAAPPHDAGPPPFAVDAQAAPAGDLRAADAALAPAATDLRTLSLPGTPGALYGGCAVGAAAHGAARGGAATALAFVLLLLAASIARLTPAQRGRTRRSRRNACARDACSRRASRDMLGGCPKT